MKIKILARSFFEACQGTPKEAMLMKQCHIISINSVGLPEQPPFSCCFLKKSNLLILHFDDVEEDGANAMTDSDAEKISAFIKQPEMRHLLIHCTAGISRSGAVGEVANWYFHRHLERNDLAFRRFFRTNPDIVPNAYVRRKLLAKIIGKQACS